MNRAREYILTASILLLVMLHSGRVGPFQGAGLLTAAPAQAGTPQSPAVASLPPLDLSPALKTSTEGQPAAVQYTGERISLNLKDVDLKDFFRLIHEISGLNIVVDPNISGTLTIAIDNVPWDQALDIVLRNNNLDKSLDGNVLRIARMDTLAAEADNRTKLARAQAEAAGLITVVRYLSYATAADVTLNNATAQSTGGAGASGGGITAATAIFGVASILLKMRAAIMSPRGMVTSDPRDNAVVITDIPTQVPIIEAVIDKLDRKSKQISIEARIVLTTSDVVHQLQSSLSGSLKNSSGSVSTTGTTGTTPTGFGTFTLMNQGAKYLIDITLSAAENRNLAKTISAPTIMTQNNVPAIVQQGTQVYIQTVINNTVTSVPVSATLALAVTPQITDDGHVFLNIQAQNNSLGPVPPGTTNPTINTQSATTQVLVPDGGVVVFGGIKLTSNTKSLNQVPGLASIPVLGNLFKSSNREDLENELIFIVTPKIIPG
jgi:type IV pilus assembly protein PilQ